MAEAFYNQMAPQGCSATSAGTQPAQTLNPGVVEAMKEVGIDMSGHLPKPLTQEIIRSAQRIISMGCGVEGSCPVGLSITEDWGIDDPADESIDKVREIRDEIRHRVQALLSRSSSGQIPAPADPQQR